MTQIKVIIENGKIVLGEEKLNELCKLSKNGEYILTLNYLSPKTKEEWRKYYFFLRDILFTDGETGYTKSELHDIAKTNLLPFINTKPENIKHQELKDYLSTNNLTAEGWQNFVEMFKTWSFEKFNCYL